MMSTPHSSKAKPLLIYDGDCGFCKYWVDYWQKLTGSAVRYQPYQAVGDQYPTISISEFQQAVQYVAEDGSISRAAKASFLTLSHAKGGGVWLALYRYLPGFAFISEKIYALIAAHRSFFYTISLFLWGREHEPPRYEVLAWLFVRAFALVFLIAFTSFGMQAMGLIGSQGIVPVANLVAAGEAQLGAARFWQIPMLFWLNHSDLFIYFICWGGALLSLLLFFQVWPRVCLLILYVFYLSLIYAGQVFMTFQWDFYLVETALICFFMMGSLTIGIWLLRWLLFRFIFAGGIVKILSGDPAWREFNALYYYFFTEPIPTPLAWYADHLPHLLLKAGAISTLIVELCMPFLIFLPRRLRIFSACCIMIFQSIILITGNYNWFNVLTILLCIVLFDDALIRKLVPSGLFKLALKRKPAEEPSRIFGLLAWVFAIVTIFISLIQFNARFTGNAPAFIAPFYRAVAPFSIVNMYGPFAVITKQRMEIIIEGSEDGLNWKEYAFKYKPGDVMRRLPWNIPFQPRLDWQMWFAALSPPDMNPWFFNFMQRLLENAPPVIALLETNPFPDKPPVYVRALYYDYRFTTQLERAKTGAWWNRGLVGYYLRDVNLK